MEVFRVSHIWVLILIILLLAWYLSFSATRLDRLHHRVETSEANLDSLLQRRAALALELVHSHELDPATELLLFDAASLTRADNLSLREDAESTLSGSLKFLRSLVDSGEAAIAPLRVSELDALTERIKLAISVHVAAVNDVARLRSKFIFRLFHLAGRAKLPTKFRFEEDEL
jgi:hypothetical protein